MVGNFRSIDPHFLLFPIPFLCPTRSYGPPLSAEKISLSLSHLVPEIIWAKICLIFHKNLSLDHFETFCTNVLLHFRSYWPPFLQLLDLFDPLIFTKPQILLGPFFHRDLDYWIFGEVPPPPPPYKLPQYVLRTPVWAILIRLPSHKYGQKSTNSNTISITYSCTSWSDLPTQTIRLLFSPDYCQHRHHQI